ncbi:MAG: hypothetical protein NTZ05_20505, partial [Chloroflexi bacterium]|nr:hypothetical protein [Chloroflexota bacterium]
MTMYAASAIAEAGDVEEALTRVLGDTAALWERHDIDLALVFVSPHFAPHYADVVQKVRQITGARLLLGCSGQGVIARTREAEDTPALALLIVAAPGADLRPVRFTQAQLARLDSPEAWREHTGVALGETNAWLLL